MHAAWLPRADRKWGQAYLTREFFEHLSTAMPERVLLVVAEDGKRPIAGALNMLGSHALFGRNWGCAHGAMGIKHLHFEVCYYQVSASLSCQPPPASAPAITFSKPACLHAYHVP
jgi:predicted N-acyltransferase